MESIVKFLEKGQPYFDKVSKNIYLQAIKDGFLAAMPIILSSSVFLLISTLPGVVATVGGFTLPDWWNVDVVNFCNKVYNFTMGVVGIMVAGTTASALTGSKNRRMPAGKASTPRAPWSPPCALCSSWPLPRRVPRSTAPMSRCSLPTTWAPRAY